jgi:two-component system, NarL family, nitrate/nitrite response regulator NarL
MNKVRVLLLDDHTIFRQGVAMLLNAEPDMELNLCTGAVGEALMMVAGGLADLVLLDLDLGQERGIDFLIQARHNGFAGPVLVLAAAVLPQEGDVLQRYGVAGILRKETSVDALADRIRETVGAPAFAGLRAAPLSPIAKKLTDREQGVLRLVIDGLESKEISAVLECTEAAVKGILQQLFRKTGTRMRSQLVRFALEHYRDQM